jgi:transposase
MQIEDGHALWTCASTEQADFGRASSLYEANASVRDVAREMEVSTGKAAKWRRRWQEERGELVLGS